MPVTNYIWDVENDSYLMETDENGVTTATYTNEPTQFGRLISQRRSNQTSYYHFDGLDSTRELTDATGAATDVYVYGAYGEAVATAGNGENHFRYIGEWGYFYDVNSVQYYVRTRHYSVRCTNWLSADPFGYAADSNLYRYVRNAPTQLVDPSGLVNGMHSWPAPPPAPKHLDIVVCNNLGAICSNLYFCIGLCPPGTPNIPFSLYEFSRSCGVYMCVFSCEEFHEGLGRGLYMGPGYIA